MIEALRRWLGRPRQPVIRSRQLLDWLEEASQGFLVLDRANRLQHLNGRARRLLGIGTEQVVKGRYLLEVVRCHRVVNDYLSYMLEKTARQLCCVAHGSRENRAVPPQGGYFHGTDRTACLSICEDGFDDAKWKGGKYGVGQYLSADASRASIDKYTRDSGMLLLVEAVLGRSAHLRTREPRIAGCASPSPPRRGDEGRCG